MRANQEVKRFLRGRYYVEDGVAIVINDNKDALVNWKGITNGAITSATAGISKLEAVYDVPSDTDLFEQFQLFASYFARIGRIAAIDSEPNTIGCLTRGGLGNPVLYTVQMDEAKEHQLLVTVFTARSAVSKARLEKALQTLDSQFDTDLGFARRELSDEEKQENKEEIKEELKAEKARKKEESRLKRAKEKEEAKEKKNALNASFKKIKK